MSMMDGDFDAWFQSLSPEDQEFVLYQMGLSEANTTPYSFGTAAPELTGPEYDLSTFNAGFPTDFNSKGEALPWGLDQEAQAATLQKNLNSLLADNITGAMAGPGAYGPDAFVPREVYGGDVLDAPGRRQAEFYTQGRGGFESLIAEAILSGDSPSQAVAKALQVAQMPDSEAVDPELRAQRDAVLMSLPPARVTGNQVQLPSSGDITPAQEFAKKYDVQALYDFADQIGAAVAKDPTGGFTDPTTGVTYANAPKQEYSGAAQKFIDLGLPFPTDNYTDEDYLQLMAPLDREGNAAMIAQAQAGADQASKGIPSYATLDELEQQLNAAEVSRRNEAYLGTPLAGVLTQQTSPSGIVGAAPRLGPVDTRAANPADQFRVKGQQAPVQWQQGDGSFNFGTNAPSGNFNPMDYVNRMLANTGANLPQAKPVTRDTVKQGRQAQEAARKARSTAMDARISTAKSENDRAAAAGMAQAMASAGRTPLTDAMLKRLMAQRAQGFYG